MKRNYLLVALVIVILALNFQSYSQDAVLVDGNGKAISAEEQESLLATRIKSPIQGTFGSLGSFLYTFHDLAIHTDHKEVGNIKLGSPFPKIYEPTWREVFDTIAVQTKTVWTYDAKRNYWLFTPAENSPSFEIKLADGWTSEHRGIYIGYKPSTFPVGMDIYQLGSYSSDDPKDEAKLFSEIRDDLALRFASGFNKDIKPGKMKKVKVDGVDALYFESPAPQRKEIIWRQWAFVKNGKGFVIVSSLRKQDANLVSDVQQMVKSFKVK